MRGAAQAAGRAGAAALSPMSGELAIVLHAHMPYLEGGGAWPVDPASYLREPAGFGTWPFGEELLFEAIASCYLPLLDVLDDAPGRVTVSLTPVLCDQLEHPGTIERCLRFLTEVRPLTHRLDADQLRGAGEPTLAAELDRSAAEYAAAATALRARHAAPGGLPASLGRHASWTSSTTHAILPLLATDAGIGLQLATGIRSHRARFGEWRGGLWLPECGYAPWLDPHLERAGVRATCVELTALLGRGAPAHLRPLASAAGPTLWPIDRATIDLVWGESGYPSRAAYRDYHRYTSHRHRVHRVDGRPYEHDAALAQARVDAAEFVAAVRERVAGGGVCVVALDAELLGHWWYEGVQWLRAVLEAADRAGLAFTTLDDALARHEPAAAPARLGVCSWGEGGDLRTWSGPRSAAFAWRTRTAELALAAAPRDRVGERALRELLALQSSDWAFLHRFELAGDYPEQRARLHADALAAALRDPEGVAPQLRGLAPWLRGWR
ncbi:MAG TPA: 1,4-alpha-glucan branching protein domain-containing protein [Solirubrobacteraceae bacterium]|nr:1,4-alpha-glucan branching protein domain-containing protein [Solirubrobacteraceae bacterium]